MPPEWPKATPPLIALYHEQKHRERRDRDDDEGDDGPDPDVQLAGAEDGEVHAEERGGEVEGDIDEGEEGCDARQVMHVAGALVRVKHLVAHRLVVVVLHAAVADRRQLLGTLQEPEVVVEEGVGVGDGDLVLLRVVDGFDAGPVGPAAGLD